MIRHRLTTVILLVILTLIYPGCVPFDKIYSHDFNSGYFDLKSPEHARRLVYVDLFEDSATVYPAIRANGKPLRFGDAGVPRVGSREAGGLLGGATGGRRDGDRDCETDEKFRLSHGWGSPICLRCSAVSGARRPLTTGGAAPGPVARG